MAERLRLSRADRRKLERLTDAAFGPSGLAEIAYRQGQDIATGAAILRAALAEQPITDAAERDIRQGAKARFPITARDLMPKLSGKALGDRLAALESEWIASGFTLSRVELLRED